MSLEFDHAIVAVHDLEQTIADFAARGFTVTRQETVTQRATRSALIFFQNETYIELLARSAESSQNEVIDFSNLVGEQEGLIGFALRTPDLGSDVKRLLASGFKVGEITEVEQLDRNGTLVHFKMALLDEQVAPFLIQDVSPRNHRIPTDPATTTHTNLALSIRAIEIGTFDPWATWEKYRTLLDIVPGDEDRKGARIGAIVITQVSQDEIPNLLQGLEERLNRRWVSDFTGRNSNLDPDIEPTAYRKDWIEYPRILRDEVQAQVADYARLLPQDEASESLIGLEIVRKQNHDAFLTRENLHNLAIRQIRHESLRLSDEFLRDLNNINWSQIEASHGPADYVPGLIRALASDDSDIRESAYETLLDGSLMHQTTLYEAGVVAFPFLIRLLTEPVVVNKHRILELIGWLFYCFPTQPHYHRQLYDLYRSSFPVFLSQVHDTDDRVRQRIVEDLGSFPEHVETLAPLFRHFVSSDPSTRVRAAALKSLEYVLLPRLEGNNTKEWERALASDNIPYFSSVKRDETQSLVVRLEAAYVLAKTQQSSLQSEAAEFFDQVMLADSLSELSHSYDEAMWLWSLVSDIVDALSFLPEERLTWIKRHAKHPDPKVRAEIVRLLKREQFTESIRVPILSESLGDSSPDVRYAALMLTWHRLDDGIGEVVDIVKSMARNDPSLMIRDRAKSLLTHFHKQETN
jgi:hypothetical protein